MTGQAPMPCRPGRIYRYDATRIVATCDDKPGLLMPKDARSTKLADTDQDMEAYVTDIVSGLAAVLIQLQVVPVVMSVKVCLLFCSRVGIAAVA